MKQRVCVIIPALYFGLVGHAFLMFFCFLGGALEPIDFDGCSFYGDPVSVAEVSVVNKLGHYPLQFLHRQPRYYTLSK
jgi:hypothetical protein